MRVELRSVITSRNIRLLMWFNLFSDLRMYMPILALYFAEVTGSLASAATVIAVPYVVVARFSNFRRVLSLTVLVDVLRSCSGLSARLSRSRRTLLPTLC